MVWSIFKILLFKNIFFPSVDQSVKFLKPNTTSNHLTMMTMTSCFEDQKVQIFIFLCTENILISTFCMAGCDI